MGFLKPLFPLNQHLSRWFRRPYLILAISLLLLLVGLISPWYQLPADSLTFLRTSLGWINYLAKSLIIAAIIYLIINHIYHRWSRFPLYLMFSIVILLPFWISTFNPKSAYLATSLYQQQQKVSRNLQNQFPDVQAQWKYNILLDQPQPITSVITFTIPDSRFFQLSSLDKIITNGLGYRPQITSFIGKGWIASLFGLSLGLISIYLAITPKVLSNMINDLIWFILFFIGVILAIVIYLISIQIVNYNLDTFWAKGAYSQVIIISDRLSKIYPPLTEDQSFLERLGKAKYYNQQPDPILINFIKGIERYKLADYARATSYFQAVLTNQGHAAIFHNYLATSMIHEGIEYFKNTHRPMIPSRASLPAKSSVLDSLQTLKEPNIIRPTSAITFFNQALQIFPNHLEALYNLMISYAINNQFEESANIAKHIIKLNQNFQQPNLEILGQAYLHQSWSDYYSDRLNSAWQKYRQSYDPKSWKSK